MYRVNRIRDEETFKETIRNRDWLEAGPIFFFFVRENYTLLNRNNKNIGGINI